MRRKSRAAREAQRLQHENDVLREMVGKLSSTLSERVIESEAENAKLRELVMDMYRCSDPCNDCPHYNTSNSGFYCGLGIGWKVRRMRELGIEVS